MIETVTHIFEQIIVKEITDALKAGMTIDEAINYVHNKMLKGINEVVNNNKEIKSKIKLYELLKRCSN